MEKVTKNGISFVVETPQDIINKILNDSYTYKIGIYGRAGSGKSRFASTHPGLKGVLDADNGGFVYQENFELVSIVEPFKGNVDAWRQCESVLEYFGTKESIKCIIIDSATAVCTTLMFEIQRLNGTLGKLPCQAEYGKLRNATIEFIHKSFSYHKDVIFLFHEATEKDELSGRVWCNPMIIGKLSGEIGRFFDEFYHMEAVQPSVGEIKYQILTKSTQMYSCKSRIDSKAPGVIDTIITTPSLDILFKALKQKVKTLYSK